MTQPSIFTQIRTKQLPGEVIYQDPTVFVIMTIAPHNPGHCLVIPIQEESDFEALSSTTYPRVMDVARQMALGLKHIYGSSKVALVIAGMEVAHTHVHLFPLYNETDIDVGRGHVVPLEQVSGEAAKIRNYLEENPIT